MTLEIFLGLIGIRTLCTVLEIKACENRLVEDFADHVGKPVVTFIQDSLSHIRGYDALSITFVCRNFCYWLDTLPKGNLDQDYPLDHTTILVGLTNIHGLCEDLTNA